jgi:hypothetical protein
MLDSNFLRSVPDNDNDETVDEEQDPKSSKDKNQFIGLDDDNLDDETMDKSDTEVLIPPDPKWLESYQSCLHIIILEVLCQGQEVEQLAMEMTKI